jgi:hypothetical protein
MAGEELGGSLYEQCPGTGCDIWEAAAGDYDYKLETGVCAGCTRCGGNPPDEEESKVQGPTPNDEVGLDNDQLSTNDDHEVDDLVADIADIIAWENAGFDTDWSEYDFPTRQLVRIWRSKEREISEIRQTRMQAWLKTPHTKLY